MEEKVELNRWRNLGVIKCAICAEETKKNSPQQRYCPTCSMNVHAEKHRKRSLAYTQKNADVIRDKCRDYARLTRPQRTSDIKERGLLTSAENARDETWEDRLQFDWSWRRTIKYPYTTGFSKNAVWSWGKARGQVKGHVFVRQEIKQLRADLAMLIKVATRDAPVVSAKVWMSLLVQKPHHHGDAINVLDLIADAVKDALPVDDRFYAIRHLDWEVVKTNPLIFLTIGQTATEHEALCSYCGGMVAASSLAGKRMCRPCSGREQRPSKKNARAMP